MPSKEAKDLKMFDVCMYVLPTTSEPAPSYMVTPTKAAYKHAAVTVSSLTRLVLAVVGEYVGMYVPLGS